MAVGNRSAALLIIFLGVILYFNQSPQMLLQSIIRNLRESAFIKTPDIVRRAFHNPKSTITNLAGAGACGESARIKDTSYKLSTMTMDIPVAGDCSKLKLLNQNEAIEVDKELFNEYRFSVDQLMELAGLSVATAIAKVYESKKSATILIITGPGNNGGDGMVAARHLKLFGFENVTILNARQPNKELFINLIHQAEQTCVNISYDAASFSEDKSVGLIVDALFGFSFKPPVRPDFQPFMDLLVTSTSRSIPVVSVDIPSGWDVERGPPNNGASFMPDALISLTAPKLCASHFHGSYHFLGGRFVPRKLADKYGLELPTYPGTDCVVRIK